MKYLGVDYGKTKVGLALSEGLSASPFQVLSVGSLEDALVKIQKVIKEEKIDQVVVGLPESGEARKIAEKFIDRLKQYIPVESADETLSSHEALQTMIKLGKSKKARSREDATSAAIILQEYLDHQ